MPAADATATDESQFRRGPPYVAGERPMYQGWLEFHRGTLLWKCAALSDDQLKSATVTPSN